MNTLAATDASAAQQLDGLLATFRWPVRGAVNARGEGSPMELPWALEQCIQRSLPSELWRACGDGMRLWLVSARAVQPTSPDPSAIALELHFFGNDGVRCGAGVWQRSGGTQWGLDAVLE